jgi:hypothetical protein
MYKIIGADGREYGPISLEGLRQWVAEGRANAATNVLVEGTSDWKKIGDLPEFSQPTPETRPPVSASPGPITPLPAAVRTNPLAITGFVLGIISVTVGLCCYGLPFNLAGIVCSAIALDQIKKDPLREGGRGIALAGLVLSILSLVLAACMLAFYFSLGGSRHWHRIRHL